MQYDITLGAYGVQRIEVAGRFFKYIGVGKIRVTTSKGGSIDLQSGQGVWGEEFNGLTVQDRSGSPNSGVLLAGSYDFRDDTITGRLMVENTNLTPVPVSKTPFADAWYHNAATTGGVALEIVAPAANVRGIRVHRSTLQLEQVANWFGGIVAADFVPVGAYQGFSVHLYQADGTPGVSICGEELVIKPGLGMYFISTTVGTAKLKSVLYTLL
jgi:hypothetical protein